MFHSRCIGTRRSAWDKYTPLWIKDYRICVSALLNTQFHQDSFVSILLCPRLLVHTPTHKER
ncbi:MAG: hypothetical protein ACE1Z2_07445, partial [Acidobacteriota bacterium]